MMVRKLKLVNTSVIVPANHHSGATGGGSGAGNGDRGSGGDAEGLLELLHELGELDEGHLLERVEELVGAQLRHEVSLAQNTLL